MINVEGDITQNEIQQNIQIIWNFDTRLWYFTVYLWMRYYLLLEHRANYALSWFFEEVLWYCNLPGDAIFPSRVCYFPALLSRRNYKTETQGRIGWISKGSVLREWRLYFCHLSFYLDFNSFFCTFSLQLYIVRDISSCYLLFFCLSQWILH